MAAMRYRLRTLLMVLALGPMAIWCIALGIAEYRERLLWDRVLQEQAEIDRETAIARRAFQRWMMRQSETATPSRPLNQTAGGCGGEEQTS